MSFFISDAMAEGVGAAAQASETGSFGPMLMLLGMFALMYFLLIRPQQKRAKEHKKMVDTLEKGDEVVTNGGMLGVVTKMGENHISVEVADGVRIKLQRNSVATVLVKGTVKPE